MSNKKYYLNKLRKLCPTYYASSYSNIKFSYVVYNFRFFKKVKYWYECNKIAKIDKSI